MTLQWVHSTRAPHVAPGDDGLLEGEVCMAAMRGKAQTSPTYGNSAVGLGQAASNNGPVQLLAN